MEQTKLDAPEEAAMMLAELEQQVLSLSVENDQLSNRAHSSRRSGGPQSSRGSSAANGGTTWHTLVLAHLDSPSC